MLAFSGGLSGGEGRYLCHTDYHHTCATAGGLVCSPEGTAYKACRPLAGQDGRLGRAVRSVRVPVVVEELIARQAYEATVRTGHTSHNERAGRGGSVQWRSPRRGQRDGVGRYSTGTGEEALSGRRSGRCEGAGKRAALAKTKAESGLLMRILRRAKRIRIRKVFVQ